MRPPLKRAWHRELGATPGFPVIAGGRVFVIAGGTLSALDRATGRTLWQRAAAAASYALAYDGGRLFVVSGRYVAQAIDPATGETLWTARIADPTMFAGSIVATGGRLYALDDGFGTFLSAFDAATGARAYRVAAASTWGMPTVGDGRVYLGEGDIEYAQAAADGRRLWGSPGDQFGDGKGTAAYHDGRVWNNRGQVLDAATGAKLRDYRSTQIPAFGDGLALLADAGALVAVDEATGAQRWVLPVEGGVVSPPLVVAGTVFAVGGSGRLVSADLATGASLGAIRMDERWEGSERTAGIGLAAGEGTLVAPVRYGVSAYVAESASPGAGLPAAPGARRSWPSPAAPTTTRAPSSRTPRTPGSSAPAGRSRRCARRWTTELLTPLRALIADGKVFTVTPDSEDAYTVRGARRRRRPPAVAGRDPAGPGLGARRRHRLRRRRACSRSRAGKLRAFDAGTGALAVDRGQRRADRADRARRLRLRRDRRPACRRSGSPTARSTGRSTAARTLARRRRTGGRCGWGSSAAAGTGTSSATRTRISRHIACGGGGTGDPVAVAGGLVAHPGGQMVFRTDSPDATPVDGLRAKVVPAFAHGLRFTNTDGVARRPRPPRAGRRAGASSATRMAVRAAAGRRAPRVRLLAHWAGSTRSTPTRGARLWSTKTARRSSSSGRRWPRAKGCCWCRRARTSSPSRARAGRRGTRTSPRR